MEPEFQKQHRISQIYLKQFGYINDSGEPYVSVYKVGEKKTENIKIIEFTTETNIFDLPYSEPSVKRHFENLSSRIEGRYSTVISDLTNQKKLTPQDKDLLNHFVANMLCRSNSFRDFIAESLVDEKHREYLFKEITMFSNDPEKELEELKKTLEPISANEQINVVMCFVMNHLVYVFRRFKKVVLKHYANIGWLTSDNPVHINRQENHEWIIPVEAEIFFPLSRDFCLFMFNSNSELKDNPLRNLKLDKVNIVDFKTCDAINKKMMIDNQAYLGFSYLIFNTETEETTFRE